MTNEEITVIYDAWDKLSADKKANRFQEFLALMQSKPFSEHKSLEQKTIQFGIPKYCFISEDLYELVEPLMSLYTKVCKIPFISNSTTQIIFSWL